MGSTIPLPVGILVLVFLVCSPIACDRMEPVTPIDLDAENTLRFNVPFAFKSLNPAEGVGSGDHWIFPLIFSSLATRMEDGRLNPDLAKSWQYYKPSCTWSIYLQQNVKFHDGSVVTARDVAFSIQQISKKIFPHLLDSISQIKPTTDHSLEIHLKRDDPDIFKEICDIPIVPSKLPLTSPIGHPIGSGPYCFEKTIDSQKVLLTAFEGYFRGRPNIKNILCTHVPDRDLSWIHLLKGQTDIAVRVSPMNLRMMKFIQNNYQIASSTSYFCKTLLYNTADPLFSDVRVRRALDFAIDRQHMTENILMGYGEVATGPFGVNSPYGRLERKAIPCDPIKAQEILTSIGWEISNVDGIRYKDGRPFGFTLLYMKEDPVNEKIARFIQICLNEIGLIVRLESASTATVIGAYRKNTAFQAVLTEVLGLYDEFEPLISTWYPHDNGCSNMGCFASPDLTNLLTILRTSPHGQKWIENIHNIEDRLLKLQPASFLFHKKEINIVSNRIQLPHQFSGSAGSIHYLHLARIRTSN